MAFMWTYLAIGLGFALISSIVFNVTENDTDEEAKEVIEEINNLGGVWSVAAVNVIAWPLIIALFIKSLFEK